LPFLTDELALLCWNWKCR